MTYKKTLNLSLVIMGLIVGAVLFSIAWQSEQAVGSVQVGHQYQSTTTPNVAAKTNLCPARVGMASSTTGVLGSVNVLISGEGSLTVYDATTTDITKRTGGTATSSITMAHFGASPTANSYHFDIGFRNGLLVDYTGTGTGVSSTTISYRCE